MDKRGVRNGWERRINQPLSLIRYDWLSVFDLGSFAYDVMQPKRSDTIYSVWMRCGHDWSVSGDTCAIWAPE